MEFADLERLAALIVVLIGVITGIIRIPDMIIAISSGNKKSRLEREQTLNTLLDNYVAKIGGYEKKFIEFEKQIDLLTDRIAALEKYISDAGMALPPLSRRRKDVHDTQPLRL